MAKVVMSSPPGAAYEIAEVSGGSSMSHAEISALLDEYIEQHGLIPVETIFDGETPRHKYGRYKPSASTAPQAATTDEVSDLKAQIAALTSLVEQATAPKEPNDPNEAVKK